MKFTVNKKELYSKLQYAIKIISNKNSLPILDCFLLGIKGTILHIAATDGEIRINTKVDISNVEGEGRVCVDANKLTNALKELPDQPLSFDINDYTKEVLIKYHNGKYSFIGEKADDYPQPKLLDEKVKQELLISSDVLFNGINSTLFATATDDLRPTMETICVDITTDNTTFVASDGSKLVKITNSETKGLSMTSFLLHKKAAGLLLKLLSKEVSVIKVRFDFNNAVFDLSEYVMTSRFVEGKYPNYNSVIPLSNKNKFIASRDILISMIRRVSVFSNQASNLIKFEITNNSLTVKGQDVDFSTAAEEEMPIEYIGEAMDIGFKSSFLLELLSSINTENVEFQLSEPNKAALIVPTSNLSGYNHLTLLMPMLISE